MTVTPLTAARTLQVTELTALTVPTHSLISASIDGCTFE